jgi:putative oxidoreductase
MSLRDTFEQVEETLHGALVRHSITALRLSVGAVFLGFGALKFFPGVSPAQGLSIKTIELLTFGLVPWQAGLVAIATLECFIGVCLLAKRWMRLAVWLLAIEFVGILAPLVLLTARLFSGPHHAPTLEGQYVLKDFILVAAGMAIAAGTFRGGRLVRDEPHPTADPGQATLVRAYERDRTARAGVLEAADQRTGTR